MATTSSSGTALVQKKRSRSTSAVLGHGQRAIAVGADLRTIDGVEYLAKAAEGFGPVALLVNNAGVTNSCASPI